MTTDDDVRRVMALEIEMQRPDVRADPDRLADLLAPDFEEVGASGRVWDRAAILDLLATEAVERTEAAEAAERSATAAPAAAVSITAGPELAPDIQVHDLVGQVITPGLVALRWGSLRAAGTPDERRARRTSLWRNGPQGWRLVRHQGTVLP